MEMLENAGGAQPSRRSNHRGTWRVWFLIGLWVFLLCQAAVGVAAIRAGTAAYPLINGPGFGASRVGTDGRTEVTNREISVVDAQGALHPVAAEELLDPMPTAIASRTVDEIFKPSAKGPVALDAKDIDYLRRQTGDLTFDAPAVGIRVVWQPEIFDAATLERTPIGEATVREVTW